MDIILQKLRKIILIFSNKMLQKFRLIESLIPWPRLFEWSAQLQLSALQTYSAPLQSLSDHHTKNTLWVYYFIKLFKVKVNLFLTTWEKLFIFKLANAVTKLEPRFVKIYLLCIWNFERRSNRENFEVKFKAAKRTFLGFQNYFGLFTFWKCGWISNLLNSLKFNG